MNAVEDAVLAIPEELLSEPSRGGGEVRVRVKLVAGNELTWISPYNFQYTQQLVWNELTKGNTPHWISLDDNDGHVIKFFTQAVSGIELEEL